MAHPPGEWTRGRSAIRERWAGVLARVPHFEQEEPRRTLVSGDLALPPSRWRDDVGGRGPGGRIAPGVPGGPVRRPAGEPARPRPGR